MVSLVRDELLSLAVLDEEAGTSVARAGPCPKLLGCC